MPIYCYISSLSRRFCLTVMKEGFGPFINRLSPMRKNAGRAYSEVESVELANYRG